MEQAMKTSLIQKRAPVPSLPHLNFAVGLLGPGSSPHTISSLASFRKPFLINPGGTAAIPITRERMQGQDEGRDSGAEAPS